uniref:Uncharacterized protein n=1 Tax=Rhizophora mucronata TaxID=61149 RepID=A0A2P2PW66_RHIMU
MTRMLFVMKNIPQRFLFLHIIYSLQYHNYSIDFVLELFNMVALLVPKFNR